MSCISRLINTVNFLTTYPKQKAQNKKWNTICMFLVARSLTFKCIRPVLSVLFHSFSFCWIMLYNRLGRRQTFAMYRQNIVHEWMIVFAVLRGLACEWASWGAGPDGSVFYYQLFTSTFIFQASKNLTFVPPSILHNINWLPHPTSPSLNRKTYFVQWSPTWPWFTSFGYLGFLLN